MLRFAPFLPGPLDLLLYLVTTRLSADSMNLKKRQINFSESQDKTEKLDIEKTDSFNSVSTSAFNLCGDLRAQLCKIRDLKSWNGRLLFYYGFWLLQASVMPLVNLQKRTWRRRMLHLPRLWRILLRIWLNTLSTGLRNGFNEFFFSF